MHFRTDPFAESMQKFFGRLHEVVTGLEVAMKNRDRVPPPLPAVSGRGAVVDSRQMQTIRDNARPFGIDAALRFAAPLIAQMSLTFLVAPKGWFFVTSDNPCVWFSPAAYRLRHPALRSGLDCKDIEITMPISPQILALVTHNENLQGYVDVPEFVVDDLNRRTIAFSSEQFVSNTEITRDCWFR